MNVRIAKLMVRWYNSGANEAWEKITHYGTVTYYIRSMELLHTTVKLFHTV